MQIVPAVQMFTIADSDMLLFPGTTNWRNRASAIACIIVWELSFSLLLPLSFHVAGCNEKHNMRNTVLPIVSIHILVVILFGEVTGLHLISSTFPHAVVIRTTCSPFSGKHKV